jgi:hypothetical protein
MMPRLGEKYDIDIQTVSKPKAEYLTDEYFEQDLPVAPAVMVGEEIMVEGTDISQDKLESAICRQLGLPEPDPSPKGLLDRLLKR